MEQLETECDTKAPPANWVLNARVLWDHRRVLLRTALTSAVVSVVVAFAIPKQYESTARITPPDTSGAGTALLAAIAGRSELGGLGSLAGSLLGARTTGPLFVDLLRSATVSNDLIDRFQLQSVYDKRYRIDTAKRLARRTAIVEDKRSGVISVSVEDSDPRRARDLAQAYLDELNMLVARTNTSSARLERAFIEHRLEGTRADLERAQLQMSEFESTHTTIDIKEQARATVEAAAKLQAQIIFERSELDSLKQVYGDENIRVRAARARLDELEHQLQAIEGTSAPLTKDDTGNSQTAVKLDRARTDFPSLRQIPRLAVPFADIYRRVRVEETLYELLTQQCELARIQEAKDVPVVRVIDLPGIPEKKSFPPRTALCIVLTALSLLVAAVTLLARERWNQLDEFDERRVLGTEIQESIRDQLLHGRTMLRRRSRA
ncbi:MAG: Wzz/FepE/Etk N-terminal domain-containing protein [Terracidiphilus sp.]